MLAGETADQQTDIYAQRFDPFGNPLGPEILVSTAQTGAQTQPAIAALSGGGFVIGWHDTGLEQNGSAPDLATGTGAMARVFDADGAPVLNAGGQSTGAAFQLNDVTADDDQAGLVLSGLPGGGFVATWHGDDSTGEDNSWDSVHSRIYGSDLQAVGPEEIVNYQESRSQTDPEVIQLLNGDLVYVWMDDSRRSPDNSSTAIRARVVDNDGTWDNPSYDIAARTDFVVNQTVAGAQKNPTVTPLSWGGFVAVWEDEGAGLDKLHAQIFDAAGTAWGAEILVAESTIDHMRRPQVATLPDGGFAIVWEQASSDPAGPANPFGFMDNQKILMQIYDLYGVTQGDPVEVTTTGHEAGVATLRDGRIIVTWTKQQEVLGDPSDLQLQIFDPRNGAQQISRASDDDWLAGSAASDQLRGAAGDDHLYGGGGDDLLLGGSGSDTAYFDASDGVRVNLRRTMAQETGQGFDRLASIENIIAGDGDDDIRGNNGANKLIGNAGADVIAGRGGQDQLVGGSGNDLLRGGRGRDVLEGGLGNDILVGGKGMDRFTFATGDGRDAIKRFQVNRDQIDLTGTTASEFADLHLGEHNGHSKIEIDDLVITIRSVAPHELDAGSFIFS